MRTSAGRTASHSLLVAHFLTLLWLLPLIVTPTNAHAQDPAWLETVPSHPLTSPPLEEPLDPDGLVRMSLEPGKAYRFRGDGVHAYLLQDGELVERSSAAVGGWVYLYHSHVEANEMVFRTREATTLTVEEGEMEEATVEAGETVEIPMTPDVKLTARFVGLDPAGSTSIYQLFLGEEDVSLAPESYRTTSLPDVGAHDQKTFQAEADKLVVTVEEGRVQVKAGHPFES